jgi:hypothetical protein
MLERSRLNVTQGHDKYKGIFTSFPLGASNYTYMINYSATFDYYDYEELKEAKKSSKQANKHAEKSLYYAKKALRVSAILAATSIVISLV